MNWDDDEKDEDWDMEVEDEDFDGQTITKDLGIKDSSKTKAGGFNRK